MNKRREKQRNLLVLSYLSSFFDQKRNTFAGKKIFKCISFFFLLFLLAKNKTYTINEENKKKERENNSLFKDINFNFPFCTCLFQLIRALKYLKILCFLC
jgi:hypothetical protein